MSVPPGLDPALGDALDAFGVLRADGSLDPAWFSAPMQRVAQVLKSVPRRAALESLVGRLRPADPTVASPVGETWHPLLAFAGGNFYFTVADDTGSSVWGVAAAWQGGTAALPDVSVRVTVPLVLLDGTGAQPASDRPVELALRVAIPGGTLGGVPLAAVRLSMSITFAGAARFSAVLEGLDTGNGRGPRDVVLDSSSLSADAVDVLGALLRAAVADPSAPAGPARSAITDHLLPLLGMGGGIPPLPFAELVTGPAALRTWMRALTTQGLVPAWLGHLAGLFTGQATAVEGSGAAGDPWRVPVLAIDAGASVVSLTLVLDADTLAAGLRIALAPGGAVPAAVIEAGATLLVVPLAGAAPMQALPSYHVLLRAPGADGAWLAGDAASAFAVRGLRCGVRGDGTALAPVLELVEVHIDGNVHPLVDLSSAHAIADEAKELLREALLAALGSSETARHLLALLGLVTPASDPSRPYLLDLAAFVVDPLGALVALHRRVLADAAHPWSHLLAELGALIGVSASVAGAGTAGDPWRLPLFAFGPATIDLFAGPAATADRLQLGVMAEGAFDAITLSLRSELLLVELPASGGPTVAVGGGQRLALRVAPLPPVQALPGTRITADAFEAALAFTPGQGLSGQAGITNVAVTVGTQSFTLPLLGFPMPAVDAANPAAGFGLEAAALDALFGAVLSRAAVSWGGYSGFVVAALLGVHGGLAGVPVGWPTLRASGGAATVLDDPGAALQDVLRRLCDAPAGGRAFLTSALPWLGAILANTLPGRLVDTVSSGLTGTGTPADPWTLPVASTGANLTFALEPAGPPPGWAAYLAPIIAAAASPKPLIQAARSLARFDPLTAAALACAAPSQLVPSLAILADALANGDELVPLFNAVPFDPAWTRGRPLSAAHLDTPRDPEAIAQILDRLDSLGTAGARVALHVSPSFGDPASWDALLAAAAMRGYAIDGAARFDLRATGIDPLAAPLDTVTAAVDHYVLALGAAQDRAGAVAQLARVVARVQELRPGATLLLVGHSTAGLVVRAFAAANSAQVGAIVTVAAPLAGTQLLALRTPVYADAVRFLQGLGPVGTPGGPLAAALANLNLALDGWEIDDPTLPPRPHDFPWDDFANSDGLATGDVPALALGSALGEPLAPALGQALSSRLTQLLAGTATPPTHLSIGLGASLPLPAVAAGQMRVRADVVSELFKLDLTAVRPQAVAGKVIAARLRLDRQGGWLVGDAGARVDPTAAASETRLAAAIFDLRFTPDDGLTVALDLRDAAHRGVSAPSVSLSAPLADPVLGALAMALGETGNAAAAALIDALVALELGMRDGAGAFTFSADALAALRLTPGTFLAGHLRAALATGEGWLGFTGGATGPWTRPETLVQLAANEAGGFAVTMGITDSTSADGTVALADGAHLIAGVTSNRHGAAAQVTFDAGIGAVLLSWASTRGTLQFTADPYLPPLTLWPAPGAATRRQWIAGAIPRLLFSGAASMVIEAVFGKGLRIGPLHALLESPARLLIQGHALGDGQGLQPAKVVSLLADVGTALGMNIQNGVVALPGAFQLSVQAPPPAGSTGVLALQLQTDAPLGGVATLALSADVDAKLEIALGGKLGLHLDLGGAPWATVDVTLEKTPAGLSLVVTPAGLTPLRLLPTFGGFDALAAGLARFLPRVLDSLVTALSSGGQPALLQAALALADALGVHDPVGGFATHADALAELTTPGALGRVTLGARAAVIAALARLFQDPGSPLAGTLPGTFAVDGGALRWTAPPLGAGTMALAVGFDDAGPRLELALDGLRVAGAAALTAHVAHTGGQTSLVAVVDADLLPALGVPLQPRLALSAGGATPSPFALTFLPLGAGSDDVLALALAPTPSVSLGAGAAQAVTALGMKFGGRALLRTAATALDTPLFSGGPTTRALLLGAQLCAQTTAGQLVPAAALPGPLDALGGLLATLAAQTTAALALGPTATLSFDAGDSGIGLRLQGSADDVAGAFLVRALFGPPDTALADSDGGLHLQLFARGSDGHFTFAPRVRAVGLGLGLSRPSGDPLFSASGFALGSAAGYLFFDLPLASGEPPAEPFGAALSLGGVALPLGLAQGGQEGNAGSGNPVAASLLRGDGATGSGASATTSAAPAVDLLVGSRRGQAVFKIQGGTAPFWLDVERTFGPLEIRRVGVQPFAVASSGPSLAMLIDGGVKVDGLTVEVDGLSISFALRDVLNPTTWQLDLSGLALAFSKGGFSIAGGLRKDPGPPVEYDGVLLIEGGGRTISAVGAYGRPQDASGSYTSLFAFVAIPATLGGPPFFFVTGLALGAGYNRALIIPASVDDVPSHPLLQAMDAGAISGDPMAALRSMRALIPARRGGFWVAAGVRFTSFGLVQSRALVYLALDGGLEIGVLGISRMLLPSSDDALVSIELALKARFSAPEMILSVQAQLTDQSWLFSRDCQLTGGFALYAHFGGGAYVLTLGGYNPHFSKPAEFPVVPRLGFRWQPSEHATASGTAYFALTTSCVMAGGSLSIDYQRGGLHAWFTADANFLVAWHPFAYDVDIAITVGASYTFEVCFIHCWHTTLSVSLGVGLRLMGPPIRGEVTLDLDVTSISLSFGPDISQPPYLPTFDAFADAFLYADDPAKEAVRALLAEGLERKDTSAPVPSGVAGDPWLVAPEVVFAVESRMPARRYQVQGGTVTAVAADVLDLAPMGDVHVGQSDLVIIIQRALGTLWLTLAIDPALITVTPVLGPVPEATWRFRAPKELAAAANNLTALTGLRVQAAAIGQGPSAVIPIATLATDDPAAARPLPLHRASSSDVTAWQTAGTAAEALTAIGASGQGSALGAADAILATGAPFASARVAAGLPGAGLPPQARRALARQRTAPPMIAPLATGLTMRPVGLPPPPVRTAAVDAAPVALGAPRLRALLRPAATTPATATPGRTTVKAPGVVRATPPAALKVAGAELRRVASAAVAPQTRPTAAGLVMTGAESGSGTGAVPAALFAAKEKAVASDGTTLGAGAVEIWDVPAASAALSVQGTCGVRITSLSRGGAVLADVDVAAPATWTTQSLPEGTARVALAALGDSGWAAGTKLKPAAGARVLSAAAGVPVAGWTASSPALRVGARVVLVPGGHIVLPADTAPPASSSEAIGGAAGALAGARGQETRLPLSTGAVVVLLDELDATARAAGDLSVAITGAPVTASQVLARGTRRALIYQLGAPADGATAVSVVVGSRSGVRTVAVLGLGGTAASAVDWLQRQNLDVTLAAGPASAGTVSVRFVPVASARIRTEES